MRGGRGCQTSVAEASANSERQSAQHRQRIRVWSRRTLHGRRIGTQGRPQARITFDRRPRLEQRFRRRADDAREIVRTELVERGALGERMHADGSDRVTGVVDDQAETVQVPERARAFAADSSPPR